MGTPAEKHGFSTPLENKALQQTAWNINAMYVYPGFTYTTWGSHICVLGSIQKKETESTLLGSDMYLPEL